jgi:hypothetical protein
MDSLRSLAAGVALALYAAVPAYSSSLAVATGNATVDGRPVMWKNRDHWSTPDGWKVFAYHYAADNSSFGSGDTYTSRFNYVGYTAEGESGIDSVSQERVPWSGVNDRGLALMQVAGHTLTSDFASGHGYSISQDLTFGMSGGYLNHIVLSRCEHVDEVEQVLRDTNNGGGFFGSTARNTSTMISVTDRYGNAAVFEIDGNSFTRDNITINYAPDSNGYYSTAHDDDKDATNPANGAYSGFDWRNNFAKVNWTKSNGFPYFVDNAVTEVVTDPVTGEDSVQNSGTTPDGVHDWEDSTSAVMRHNRAGIRMDDAPLKDYRYFIHKNVGSGALGTVNSIETLSKNIGELPYDGIDKPTGYHLNRFVSTFGAVTIGAKSSDPYDGKLAASWVSLGEPTVGLFVPLFPYAGTVPASYADLYQAINAKRHLVYSYVDDDADDYSGGRNSDHSLDTVALAGPGGYYGEGGIQKYTFAIEDWAFDQFDGFIASLRTGSRTLTQLRSDMQAWQANVGTAMKNFYVAGAWPNSYEAESWANTLTGSVARTSSVNGSWQGKVTGIGPSSDLTFQKVRVVGPGTYQLKIHYAATGSQSLSLSVNGGTASNVSFASTGGADVIGTRTVNVTLASGDNNLRFFNSSTSATPAIDRVEVSSNDTIVDNTDTGFTTAGTGWNANSSTSGYWGRNYLSDGTTAADANTKYARWTPNIAVAGNYKIYMRWAAASNRPDAAPVRVQYNGGVDNTKTVNQQTNGGAWVEIGTYALAAGTSNYVQLLCTDAGFTIADAVRFEKL